MNEETGMVKKVAREFDIDIERRMRTAIFVQALFKQKGIIITLTQALEKLRDAIFVSEMVTLLGSVEDQLNKPLDLQENPEETISKLAEMYFSSEKELGETIGD